MHGMTSAGWYDAGRKSGSAAGGSPACTSRCLPTAAVRLSKLKLAGFKTFVDPTTVLTPATSSAWSGQWLRQVEHHRRRALGAGRIRARPRCAASRWDVIFNGSTTRKPVSRASVELVFDNAEGRAAGWCAIRRDLGQARARPLGRVDLLHQQRPGPPQGRDRPLPGHRSGSARLRLRSSSRA